MVAATLKIIFPLAPIALMIFAGFPFASKPNPEKEVAAFLQVASGLAGKDMASSFNLVREELGYTKIDSKFGLAAEKVQGDTKGSLIADKPCSLREYFLIFYPREPYPIAPKPLPDLFSIVSNILGEPNGIMKGSQGKTSRVWLRKEGLIQVQDQAITYWSGEPLDRAESIKLSTMPDLTSIAKYFTQANWLSHIEGDTSDAVVHIYTSPNIRGGWSSSPLEVHVKVQGNKVTLIRIEPPFVRDGSDLRRYPIGDLFRDLGVKESATLAGPVMSKSELAISGTSQEKRLGNFVLILHCSPHAFPGKLCQIDLWRRPDFVSQSCSQ